MNEKSPEAKAYDVIVATLFLIPVILIVWVAMAFFIRFYFTGSFLP